MLAPGSPLNPGTPSEPSTPGSPVIRKDNKIWILHLGSSLNLQIAAKHIVVRWHETSSIHCSSVAYVDHQSSSDSYNHICSLFLKFGSLDLIWFLSTKKSHFQSMHYWENPVISNVVVLWCRPPKLI